MKDLIEALNRAHELDEAASSDGHAEGGSLDTAKRPGGSTKLSSLTRMSSKLSNGIKNIIDSTFGELKFVNHNNGLEIKRPCSSKYIRSRVQDGNRQFIFEYAQTNYFFRLQREDELVRVAIEKIKNLLQEFDIDVTSDVFIMNPGERYEGRFLRKVIIVSSPTSKPELV